MQPGLVIEGLPTYTAEEVARHNSLETGVWVTYKRGVYDITEFVRMHPGGTDRIMMAAGRSIEPFWNFYAQHQNPQVYQILEEQRIGNLEAPTPGSAGSAADVNDPFANEPPRGPIFRVLSQKPFNAEPPPSLLAGMLVTPNDLFFIRNHLPVPAVGDAAAYRLELRTEDGSHVVRVSLEDLKRKFRKHVFLSTLQCAGNRREEMSSFREVQGLSWGHTAISTATWGGVLLRDLLEHYRMTDDLGFRLKHVHFIGMDNDGLGVHYAASIPASKALSEYGDVLLAWEMNGSELPRDHGFPLRVIVPGYVGARNVKWLKEIVLSDHEVESHWQKKDYKILAPGRDWQNATESDYKHAVAIHDMPITSAICVPAAGAVLDAAAGEIEMTGFAFSGGGRRISRVDVSSDGGRTWISASIVHSVRDDPNFIHPEDFEGALSPEARRRFEAALQAEESDFFSGRTWHWALWSARVPVEWDEEARKNGCQLIVKAIDESYNAQPRDVGDIWNVRGLLNSSWHGIRVFAK